MLPGDRDPHGGSPGDLFQVTELPARVRRPGRRRTVTDFKSPPGQLPAPGLRSRQAGPRRGRPGLNFNPGPTGRPGPAGRPDSGLGPAGTLGDHIQAVTLGHCDTASAT